MARYIDADKLYQETEKKIKAENSQGLAVMDDEFLDLIDNAPTADVVPKGEVESINPIQEAAEQKKKEDKENTLGVLHDLLNEKDAEIKRLQNELVIWKQNRFNFYQKLELHKMAREKVAREIFEEIEKEIKKSLAEHNNKKLQYNIDDALFHLYHGITASQMGMLDFIAELKKKYTGSEDKI